MIWKIFEKLGYSIPRTLWLEPFDLNTMKIIHFSDTTREMFLVHLAIRKTNFRDNYPRCSVKKVFLKMLQYSQEYLSGLQLY